MPSVFAPTDAIYSLFRSLTHQALEQRPDAADAVSIGSYHYVPEEGGFLIKLYRDEHNDPFEVGYLPKKSREKRGTIAKFASATEQRTKLFQPSDTESAHQYLKTLLWALDHDRDGIIEVKVPEDDEVLGITEALGVAADIRAANAPQMVPAPETATPVSAAAEKGRPQVFATRVSFETLAQDVLAGRSLAASDLVKLRDSFEVWGSRQDPSATVIVRHFDHGAALAIAAFMPERMENQIDFEEALYLLIQSHVDSNILAPAPAVFKALRLMEGADVQSRLSTALEQYSLGDGICMEPGITGIPSAQTLAYLESCATLNPSGDERREDDEDLSDFVRIARLRLLCKKDYAWTLQKEEREERRIELLENTRHPGALVIIEFEPDEDEIYCSAFIPETFDETQHDEFLSEVRRLGAERKFDSLSPLPLSVSKRFSLIVADRTETLLREFADQSDSLIGCYHDFEPMEFAAPGIDTSIEEHGSDVGTSFAPEEFSTLVRTPGSRLH